MNKTAKFIKRQAVLFLFVLIAGMLYADPMLLDTIMKQGLDHYFAGNYNASIDYFEQVLQMQPQSAQARFYLANAYGRAGKTVRGIEQAEYLNNMFPGTYAYGLLLQQLKQQQTAMAGALQPVRSDSLIESSSGYEIRSPVSSSSGSRNKKRSVAKTVRRSGRIYEAVSLIDDDKYASATALINEILKQEPKNSEAMHYLGVISFNQGLHAEAVEYFEKAVGMGSRLFETRFLAGSSYLNLQNLVKAEEHFRKALEIKEDMFAAIHLAEIVCKEHRLDEAEAMFKKLRSRYPDLVDARVGLVQIEFERGDIEGVVEQINEILVKHPESARARFLKARILMEHKLYTDAAEEARLAFQNDPLNTEFRAGFALALIRNFNVPEGMAEVEKIRLQYPDSVDAILAQAEGLVISGSSAEAEKLLLDAEKYLKHPEIYMLLGSIALNGGRNDEALKHYQNFRKKAGIRPRYLMEFARFLETSGAAADAQKAYGEVIKHHPGTFYAKTAEEAIAGLKSGSMSSGSAEKPSSVPIPGL